jgi:hypothetical protein
MCFVWDASLVDSIGENTLFSLIVQVKEEIKLFTNLLMLHQKKEALKMSNN